MWAVGRFQNLADFFQEGKDLGFDRFELNHAIDSAMLDGLSLNGMIPSVHEPCPADVSTAVLKERNWLISATEEENRQQGMAAVRRSIDLAHELGARVVIVHPGRVDVDPAYESKLVHLYHSGKFDQPEYVQAKQQYETARAAQADVNMKAVQQSLLELAEYADRLGIRLALENRFHYHEIPLPDELDKLLNLGCGDVIGYWHDIGHAQVLQHQGFYPHEEWLRRFAGHMLGVHLHDVIGIKDHLAAGKGVVDWEMIASYLPANVLLTHEVHSSNSPKEVMGGARWLHENGYV
jgi:sugar phosphate isomerase/epimerase